MEGLTGVYYAAVAEARIEKARRVCDEHVVSAWTGRCLGCGRPGPCRTRLGAEWTLDRYRQLPRRVPGASLDADDGWPHLCGQFDWFRRAAGEQR